MTAYGWPPDTPDTAMSSVCCAASSSRRPSSGAATRCSTCLRPRGSSSMSDAPELEPHVICLLRAAPNRLDVPDEELDAIQERHVAYQQQLRADGKIAAAGPFSDQPDESWRGL